MLPNATQTPKASFIRLAMPCYFPSLLPKLHGNAFSRFKLSSRPLPLNHRPQHRALGAIALDKAVGAREPEHGARVELLDEGFVELARFRARVDVIFGEDVFERLAKGLAEGADDAAGAVL